VSSNEVVCGLIPELDVSDLAVSLDFYRELVGFTLVFERPAERFAYLDLEGSSLMLQETAGPGRRFRTGLLERPFGRGINFQTAVGDVDILCRRVLAAGLELIVPLEERWYDVDVLVPTGRWHQRGPMAAGNRQFVVADPDGYQWWFYTNVSLPHRS
jgi:catechol 2,3-dioxygenase-like lactoylglutathione lyase family enzyme